MTQELRVSLLHHLHQRCRGLATGYSDLKHVAVSLTDKSRGTIWKTRELPDGSEFWGVTEDEWSQILGNDASGQRRAPLDCEFIEGPDTNWEGAFYGEKGMKPETIAGHRLLTTVFQQLTLDDFAESPVKRLLTGVHEFKNFAVDAAECFQIHVLEDDTKFPGRAESWRRWLELVYSVLKPSRETHGELCVMHLPLRVFEASAVVIETLGRQEGWRPIIEAERQIDASSYLSVTLDPPVAIYDGTQYQIDPDGAMLLEKLLQVNYEWVSGKQIPDMRADRVRAKLPGPIKGLVDVKPGLGFRLRPKQPTN